MNRENGEGALFLFGRDNLTGARPQGALFLFGRDNLTGARPQSILHKNAEGHIRGTHSGHWSRRELADRRDLVKWVRMWQMSLLIPGTYKKTRCGSLRRLSAQVRTLLSAQLGNPYKTPTKLILSLLN
jgi:hypothetical protein